MATAMNFPLENYTAGVYRVSVERTRDKANAPCALLIFANDEQMYEDPACTITGLKNALEIHLGLGDGSLTEPEPSVAFARRGAGTESTPAKPTPKSAAGKPVAKPAIAAGKAAVVVPLASVPGKRPFAFVKQASADPLELANLAIAKLDSANVEQRMNRIRELRAQFFEELDGENTTIDLDDEAYHAKMAEVPARAMKQAREEFPENPRASQLKEAKASVLATRDAAAVAEAELVALLEEIEGSASSSSSAPPPAKKAKK
jgi:hypothetical protein